MPRIPDDIIDNIRDAVDITEIIGEHVQLKHNGTRMVGLCPFHEEKTPSFTVTPGLQMFKCFGCGEGGSVFKFLQKVDDISFYEAVQRLSDRTGIPLPKTKKRYGNTDQNSTDSIYQANDIAQKFYHHVLLNEEKGKRALSYLRSRNVSDEIIEQFGIGYAPGGQSWDELLKVAHKKHIDPNTLEHSGLAIRRKSGNGHYDRFRDRVVFPIRNVSSKTIGFGGRVLQADQEPKYLNSPETPIYQKSRVLYSLDIAKETIRHSKSAIVVEGYMDVISLAQAGVQNVVATSGTALTENQCMALERFTDQVVLLFDGDNAGSNAALRGVEVLLTTGIEARIVSLPNEHDPDTFVQMQGVNALLGMLDEGLPLLQFYLQNLSKKYDLKSNSGRSKALQDLKPLLLKPRDPLRRDLMLREISQRLAVDENILRSEISKNMRRHAPSQKTRIAAQAPQQLLTAEIPRKEKEFIGFLLKNQEFLSKTISSIKPEYLESTPCQRLLQKLFESIDENSPVDSARLTDQPELSDLAPLVSECVTFGYSEDTLNDYWKESISSFRRRHIEKKITEKRQELTEAQLGGDNSKAKHLSQEINKLNIEKHQANSE
ncbi:MAG: DNA primase [Candidatus Latescibacterota bacterium]|nr:DNA primase [Candidatus Latescibacterota bacterium]